MSKLNLARVLSNWLSPEKLNTNFDSITTIVEDTLSRSGLAPNAMEADLDLGLNRIINVGAPIDATDAVRLQDLNDLTVGAGSGGPIVSTDVTDFQEAVEDVVGSSVVAGTNVSVSYDDVTGKTTVSSTGSVAGTVDWVDVTGKPTTFAPSTHTHAESDVTGLVSGLATLTSGLAGKASLSHTHSTSDIVSLQEYIEDTVAGSLTAGTDITLSYNDPTGKLTISSTASGSGAGAGYRLLSEFASIDGGGINTANNDTAFAAAEAASDSTIYIPDGIYATTVDPTTLEKHYIGRGQIKYGSNYYPANLSSLLTLPSPASGLQITGWFTGDQVFSESEYKIIGPNVRKYDLAATYFQSSTIPHNSWFDINSGNSGYNGRLSLSVASGATSMTLTGSGDTDWIGHTFGFVQGQDAAVVSTHTVTNVSGPTVTFTPATAQAFNTSYGIKFAPRTWNGHTYVKVKHNGGGDGYGHIVRMTVGYAPPASEDHVFFTATGGQYGGDVNFSASGTYATGWESQYNDNGNDNAVIAQVDSFNRTNDTAARGAFWLGSLFQSVGSKPADAGHVLAGKWRVGLDTTRADLTTYKTTSDNLNVAINTKLGHRWVMNSTVSTAERSGHVVLGTGMYGNSIGDMFIESGNDGISDFIAMRFNRSSGNDARLRIRPNAVQINTDLAVAKSIGAGTDMFLASSGVLAFGAGSGNYLYQSGGHVYWHSSNGTSSLIA